eukprot:5084041-Pleurochrysis_carterae.AAC.2
MEGTLPEGRCIPVSLLSILGSPSERSFVTTIASAACEFQISMKPRARAASQTCASIPSPSRMRAFSTAQANTSCSQSAAARSAPSTSVRAARTAPVRLRSTSSSTPRAPARARPITPSSHPTFRESSTTRRVVSLARSRRAGGRGASAAVRDGRRRRWSASCVACGPRRAACASSPSPLTAPWSARPRGRPASRWTQTRARRRPW